MDTHSTEGVTRKTIHLWVTWKTVEVADHKGPDREFQVLNEKKHGIWLLEKWGTLDHT